MEAKGPLTVLVADGGEEVLDYIKLYFMQSMFGGQRTINRVLGKLQGTYLLELIFGYLNEYLLDG